MPVLRDAELAELAATLSGPDKAYSENDIQQLLSTADKRLDFNKHAIGILKSWRDNPVKFARECLGANLDEWQQDALVAISRCKRVAMKACKGPGKTAAESIAAWWFVTTRRHANVTVSSITLENLRSGLWKELAKWYSKSPYLQRVFSFGRERIVYRDSTATWWIAMRGWARDADEEQQATSFAGLHSDHVMSILDEVSDYAMGVFQAAQGIFTTCQEAKLVVAGNCTHQGGPLWHICTKDLPRWSAPDGQIITITGDPDDPKRSPRIDINEARELIRLYGREDPLVKTNILGEFPAVSADKLLGPDDLLAASQRKVPEAQFRRYPKIGGLDVAWTGTDDSVLTIRQGAVVYKPKSWHGLDEEQLAHYVLLTVENHNAQASKRGDLPIRSINVDGVGYGHGVLAALKRLGNGIVTVNDVQSEFASPDARYGNLRTWMWHEMALRIRRDLSIPTSCPRLVDDLLAPRKQLKHGNSKSLKVWLESKDEMRRRGIKSPDYGDSLAFTFAFPEPPPISDSPQSVLHSLVSRNHSRPAKTNFDPFKRY